MSKDDKEQRYKLKNKGLHIMLFCYALLGGFIGVYINNEFVTFGSVIGGFSGSMALILIQRINEEQRGERE